MTGKPADRLTNQTSFHISRHGSRFFVDWQLPITVTDCLAELI